MTRHIPIAVFCCALLLSTASCEHQPVPSPTASADWWCMLKNIYHEAGGEGVKGMQAVALVTLNRAKQKGKTVCEVVFAPKQFSWANTEKGRNKPLKGNLNNAYDVATQAMAGKLHDFTDGATHYHTIAVKPVWRTALNKLVVINNHIFYKEKTK